MPIRCPRCGAEFDVALFPFGRDVTCECGGRVSALAPHEPPRPWPMAVVFTRPGCHLCDVAKETLARRGIEFVEVDVDGDESLRSRFGDTVPVVYLEGVRRFAGRIDEALLARWLRARGKEA